MLWRRARWLAGDQRNVTDESRLWLSLVLCASTMFSGLEAIAQEAAPSAGLSPQQPLSRALVRNRTAATLDDRIRLLSKELDLSSEQQTDVRGILERQRAAVRKIWSDSTLLPGERGPAMRAVSEHTADQIRAILTEAQRQKYNPAPPTLPASGAGSAEVQVWMDKMHPSRPVSDRSGSGR